MQANKAERTHSSEEYSTSTVQVKIEARVNFPRHIHFMSCFIFHVRSRWWNISHGRSVILNVFKEHTYNIITFVLLPSKHLFVINSYPLSIGEFIVIIPFVPQRVYDSGI